MQKTAQKTSAAIPYSHMCLSQDKDWLSRSDSQFSALKHRASVLSPLALYTLHQQCCEGVALSQRQPQALCRISKSISRKKPPLCFLDCLLGAHRFPCTTKHSAACFIQSWATLVLGTVELLRCLSSFPSSCEMGVNQELPALWKTKRARCGMWAQLCPFNNL